MKFSIEQVTLQTALAQVQRATATRVIQPILGHVLIESLDANTLKFAATDLDLGIEVLVPAQVQQEGRTTISAKKLFEIVSKLPAEPVHLEVMGDSQLAKIQCGSSVFDVKTLPADEFPVIQHFSEKKGVQLRLAEFLRAIHLTAFAAATYEVNNVLGGVYFKLDPSGQMEMAATDGSRLACCKETLASVEGLAEQLSVIIPARTLQEFSRLAGSLSKSDLYITLEEGQISFQVESVYLVSRLLDGQYPQYQQLIPENYQLMAVADRQSLIRSLERTAVMANERTNIVKMTFDNNQLSLMAQTPDLGDSKDSLSIDYKGDELKIAFNYKYVLDALKVIESDDVRVELNGGLSPTLFKAKDLENFVCLVMPVQVK
ncbi:MAG: DNA polymerase III subunit beta [Cyanobacteria bacterium HKST-UBA06]|nr:DNA polymerase III subunit beta [Cyanobacteria bacterium HKST-UBA06]